MATAPSFKYTISCRLPPGPAKDAILSLAKLAGGQVFEAYVARTESPHFTLKYWFIGREEELDKLWLVLDEFSTNSRPAEVSLCGIGHFSDRVAFVKLERSEEAANLVKSLTSLLASFPWMQWQEFDDDIHGPTPHSTVFLDEDHGVNEKLLKTLAASLGSEKIPFLMDNICVSRRAVDEVFTGYKTTSEGALDVDNIWKTFPLNGT